MKFFLALLTLAVFMGNGKVKAQCSGGYTKCNINWDYLKFFPSAGISTYTNLARSQNQAFSFGTQKLSITHNFTGSNAKGEDALHTGEAGSYGAGGDLHFVLNGNVSIAFQNPVDSIQFSLYDIDVDQTITITSAGAQVTLSTLAGTILGTPTGNGTATATITATASLSENIESFGTVNVLIKGSISNISITGSTAGTKNGNKEDGDWWISDISACSPGAFSSNYFLPSKPSYVNQPGYVIAVRDNNVFYVDPTTGKAKLMFTDPGHTNINSMGYDPVKRYLYYVYSLTGSGSTTNPANKALRRYDYNVDTFGIVINDITGLIPTFEAGVESGAAAFYDGSLYLGIEADNGGSNKSIIWKVEFNGSNVPFAASQVYAVPGAGHDWADFAVVNGMLYDFDGSTTGAEFSHINLYTHSVTNLSSGSMEPRQAAVDWNNNVFHLGPPATGSTANIAPYLYNGTLNTTQLRNITYNGTAITGSWGDAAEAFKPRVDFGDAPASFDPVTGDPAVHEVSSTLFLGTNKDDEWTTRGQTTLANSDNFDDAIITGSLVNPSAGTFFAEVRYLNNTGTTASICAWVDFNNNGLFDQSEGLLQTALPSNASAQTAYFNWTGVSSSLTNGSYTYLRLRITTTANAMTTADPIGYFSIGEVEDHRLVVTTTPLATQLVKFTATKIKDENVSVNWQVASEEAGLEYTIQRSANAMDWIDINSLHATTDKRENNYNYLDGHALAGNSYYRLKMTKNTTIYSTVQKIESKHSIGIQLVPNPASHFVSIMLNAETESSLTIQLLDVAGRVIQTQNSVVIAGVNRLPVAVSTLSDGLYWLQIFIGGERHIERLVIKK